MKTISIANHKGGVAKTQTALELACWYARRQQRVLLLDLDAQANATDILLAGDKPAGRTIPEILIEGNGIALQDIMTRMLAIGLNVDYVCSSIRAARLEARITSCPKEFALLDALKPIAQLYDVVLIDTPPSAELLGLGALIASNEVIIPVTPDRPSIDGAASVVKLINAVKGNNRLNPDLALAGLIVTRYRRTRSADYGIAELNNTYGKLLAKPAVRECTRVQQATRCGCPVSVYDAGCTAARDYDMAFNYLLVK